MVFAGLLAGIAFQQAAKHTPPSAVMELALVHGHAFLLGVVLPLILTWLLHLGITLGWPPVGARALRIGAWLYLPSSTAAVLLMFYKGSIEGPHVRGHHARAAVYGLTHTALAVGLGIIATGVLRTSWQTHDCAHAATEA